jgi:hypothetical protein
MENKSILMFCLIGILLISGVSAVFLNDDGTDVNISKDILADRNNNAIEQNTVEQTNKPIVEQQNVVENKNNINLAEKVQNYVTKNNINNNQVANAEMMVNEYYSAEFGDVLDEHTIIGVHDNQVYTEPIYNTKIDYLNNCQDTLSDNLTNNNVDIDHTEDSINHSPQQYKNEYCINVGNDIY